MFSLASCFFFFFFFAAKFRSDEMLSEKAATWLAHEGQEEVLVPHTGEVMFCPRTHCTAAAN
jgi:hypothetical protein